MARVIVQLGATTVDRGLIEQAYPDVELVEFEKGPPPPGLKADAFFGGFMFWDDVVQWIDAAGVRWVQLSGTGVDKVPGAVFDGRVVTCARGAAAGPISEWVLAAVLAYAKRMPETFLSE